MNTEFADIEIEFLQSITTNRKLELIILPTESCNFRCIYCYENFKQGKMKKEKVAAIKKLIRNRVESLDQLTIQWFGGEPLLASDIMIDIGMFIQELQKEFQFEFRSSVTTNGYLLEEELVRKLVSFGINNYQISLDGTRELHNETRITARKEGTFDNIWSNLLNIRDCQIDAKILLRIHLRENNISDVKKLVQEIKESFIFDDRFSVFFKPIAKLGGENDANLDIINKINLPNIVSELEIELYGDNVVSKEFKLENNVCYASKANSFVIRANGDIGKCTVALYDSRNKVGHLHDNGKIIIEKEKINPWLKGIKNLDLETMACPLKTLTAIRG